MKNLLFWAKKRYRVVEEVMGDGTRNFYAQRKNNLWWPWSWETMKTDPNSFNEREKAKFGNLKAANDFIYKKVKREEANTVVKREKHVFDEVFHIMSDGGNSNNNTSEDSAPQESSWP